MSNLFDEMAWGARNGRSQLIFSSLLLGLAGLAACGGSDETSIDGVDGESTASTSQASFGRCVRSEPVLRSPTQKECAVDSNCPCGSFCDDSTHVCKFTCMVPPANGTESCAAGTQCDDTGRCVGPSTAPPANAVQIATLSPTLVVAPAAGGVTQMTTQLRLFTSDSAALTRAVATVVRVNASAGLEVSCNASTYGASCSLTSWTFSWDGTRQNANKNVWVRSKSTNTTAAGQVTLVVDELGLETVVPTQSSAPATFEGVYAGIATSASITNGVPVTVRARGSLLLVRDASQTLAPKGAFVLDYLTQPNQLPTVRRMNWLQPVGAAATAGALMGEVKAVGMATHTPATKQLTAGFTIQLANSSAESWSLQLYRSKDAVAECSTTADCASGSECVAALQACVPSEAWTPPTAAFANNFEDPRSASWWSTIAPTLGLADSTPPGDTPAKAAFATTGADMIEALQCSTIETEAGAGRLGVEQLKQGGISRSGDLQCVSGPATTTASGTPTLSPGAVGLVTYRDRTTANDTSLAQFDVCLQDLQRLPTSNWAQNYASSVGRCANLARFIPALRLLSTGELDKRTKVTSSPRLRGLTARLIQQWAQLQGFLASTGLSDREYDDAVSATLSDARVELLKLLDLLDAGWATLLDNKVAATVTAAATWAPTDTDATYDYRLAKKPLVYWPFNRTPTPQRDIMRGVDFVPVSASSKVGCQIRTDRDLISGDWNCPGFIATLPTTAPNLANVNDITVSMFADEPSVEFPPYGGGTLFQTETLAAVTRPLQSAYGTIAFVHPTANNGTEWVAFDWVYGLSDASFAIVRDSTTMTYTLYVYQAWMTNPQLQVFTQRYSQPVAGRLPIGARTIRLGVGNGSGQFPNTSNFAGGMDDFAIFDSALSKREVLRFATARGMNAARRDTWPIDMALVAQPMQEINVGVGAGLLEAQLAHLDVVARLAEHLNYEAPAACSGDPIARADLDAAVARAGRSLRQSTAIEALAAADVTDRAQKARVQLRAKRSKVVRTLHTLYTCEDPYGLDDNEVPLYFGDPLGETEAFFAASDYLLALAKGRSDEAVAALNLVRSRWDSARQSKIQEQLTATSRAIRVEEQETRFGEQLKRLCGITERTIGQIVQQVKDGTFVVDTCFIDPKPECQTQAATVLMDTNPSCFRGVIGAQLMEMRASYHAQQGAYQSWQNAAANTEAAERNCVLKEMDLYGCSALNRHALTGVSCPAGFEGTVELTQRFNTAMNKIEEQKSWFTAAVGVISTAAAVVSAAYTGGASLAFLAAAGGALGAIAPLFNDSAEQTRRTYEAALQKRSAEAVIRDCWVEAAQYRRAIASAEQSALEASDRMQVAIIQHKNAVAEAREILVEAPIAIDREVNRPSIPVAFHYWLPEDMFNYRFLMTSARRYAYMGLRAAEYDLQQKFTAPPDQLVQPSRAAVVSAWRPTTLTQQIALLQAATASRKTGGARPARSYMVMDVGSSLLGLPTGTDLSTYLAAYARPVYSTRGEYLGEGVHFSFVPKDGTSAPVWRCAERLWRVNAARDADFNSSVEVRLLKRTVFGSRDCSDDSMRVSTLHPEKNLLVAGGELFPVEEQSRNTVASINSVNMRVPDYDAFLNNSDFFSGSSTELAGQGLFGDYVILFTAPLLQSGLSLESVHGLNLRFDFLSVDNLPPTLSGFGLFQMAKSFMPERSAPQGELKLDTGTAPIIVD